LVAVLFLPLLFIPLLGYAIAATRAAEADPTLGPPPWRLSRRLIVDGWWTTLVIAITVAPFVVAWRALTAAIPVSDPAIADVIAFFALALLWGLLVLLLLPHATAAYSATGEVHDLLDVAAAVRGVRREFATWNAVVAAIVTAWAIGLACIGLLFVGIVPGVFYAILVSAHATSALRQASTQSSRLPTG
jgi:hypothetical protein